jgi:tetratricopeptide (TPR) repeat protein
VSIDDIGFHLLDPSSPLGEVKPHIARELRKHIEANGATNLEKTFADFKTTYADRYDFGEMEINSLGYYYIGQKKIDAALAVFKINTIEYPASSNVWDSYGEALMLHGDTAAAIENYQRSLELNPGNTNAVTMLAKMGVEAGSPDVEISQNILKSYEGTYNLMPGFSIVITLDGHQLRGQATGQPAFDLFAKNETEFFLKIVDAQIKFNTNDDVY